MMYRRIRAITSLILSSAVLSGMSGCTASPASSVQSVQEDALSQAIAETVDSSILQYDRMQEEYPDAEGYCYIVVSKNADGSCQQIRNLYTAANTYLQSEDAADQKVTLYIEVPHYDPDAYCIIAYLQNYDEDGTYDQICTITVNGLDDSAEMYKEGYSYEVNDRDYWNSYSGDCDIVYSEAFERISN